MPGAVTSYVTGAASAVAIFIQGTTGRSKMRLGNDRRKRNILHGFKYNGIVSHAEIVVSTPDFNLRLHVRSVRDREFVCKPVYSVEVTIGLVVVLLLQLSGIKLFIVKTAGMGRAMLQVSRSGLKRFRGRDWVKGLGSFKGIVAFLRGRKLFRRPGSGEGLAGMRTLLNAARRYVDALVLVNLDYVGALREASKALDELSRPFGKSCTHDGAFCSLFREPGKTRKTRGGRSAQCAKRGGFGTSQEGARRGEFCERGEFFH